MYQITRTIVSLFVLASTLAATARRLDNQVVPNTLNLPDTVATGAGFNGTVVVSAVATSDTVVGLSAGTGASIPSSVTVREGTDRATFAGVATASGILTITAACNGASVSRDLTVGPVKLP